GPQLAQDRHQPAGDPRPGPPGPGGAVAERHDRHAGLGEPRLELVPLEQADHDLVEAAAEGDDLVDQAVLGAARPGQRVDHVHHPQPRRRGEPARTRGGGGGQLPRDLAHDASPTSTDVIRTAGATAAVPIRCRANQVVVRSTSSSGVATGTGRPARSPSQGTVSSSTGNPRARHRATSPAAAPAPSAAVQATSSGRGSGPSSSTRPPTSAPSASSAPSRVPSTSRVGDPGAAARARAAS